MSADAWWTLLATVAMAVGLVGTVVPLLPGPVLMWVTALVYGLVVGFDLLGVAVMALITLLVGFSFVMGVVLPKRAAEQSGASKRSQLGGLIGAVIGFFVIPVIGLLLGALVGVMLVEYLAKRDANEAWAATKGVAKGFGLSALLDLAVGLLIVAAWAGWAITVVL
jgi:uncharacterized protein YqgC (DUF456 family)